MTSGWTAHREHLYQRAVQSGLTHRDVLLVYVAWLVTAAGAALFAGQGLIELFAGWAIAIAGLVAVWRWVVGRESKRAGAT